MSLPKTAKNILTFCANKRKMQMLQEGVRSLSQTVVSLTNDIHNLAKASTSVEDTLKAVFPNTVETVQRNSRRLQAVEEQLFPMLPQTGEVYLAQVVRPCITSDGKEGYWCTIPMRPAFHFSVAHTNEGIEHPDTLVVKCLNSSKEEFVVLTKEERRDAIIFIYEEKTPRFRII